MPVLSIEPQRKKKGGCEVGQASSFFAWAGLGDSERGEQHSKTKYRNHRVSGQHEDAQSSVPNVTQPAVTDKESDG